MKRYENTIAAFEKVQTVLSHQPAQEPAEQAVIELSPAVRRGKLKQIWSNIWTSFGTTPPSDQDAQLGMATATATITLPHPHTSHGTPSQQENTFLTAILAAGVTTPGEIADMQRRAEEYDTLKAKADAYDARTVSQKDTVKKLLVVLYPNPADRMAEASIIDALPVGAALDRYCANAEKAFDEKLGTTAHLPAARLTIAPHASPATISADLRGEEMARMEAEIEESMNASFGKRPAAQPEKDKQNGEEQP